MNPDENDTIISPPELARKGLIIVEKVRSCRVTGYRAQGIRVNYDNLVKALTKEGYTW